MRDFTLRAYELLIEALKEKGYGFYHFREFVATGISQGAVLRHDVDRYPARAQKMAELEFKMSVRSSFHFRVPEYPSASYESVIRSIAGLGMKLHIIMRILERRPGSWEDHFPGSQDQEIRKRW